MEQVLYFSRMDGISIEHVRHTDNFNMQTNHFHNEYEIFYLIQGERRFFFNNRSYLAQAGNLILVNENAIHMTQAPSEQDPGYERVILYIDKEKMQAFDKLFPELQIVDFFKQHYGIFRLNEQQQAQFLSLYHFLKNEIDAKKLYTSTIITLEILMYFTEFIRVNKSHPITVSSNNSPKCKIVYSVADYISEHYAETISLNTLASQFSLSKYYLCRSFKEITGYGINEYVHIQRIQQATRLLQSSDSSIAEIAKDLGYENITHFEKLFKSYMKISPSKYRKTNATLSYRSEDQIFLSSK